MKTMTIVWDFDGTILPHAPYDSEQTLLMHVMNRKQETFGWFWKVFARAMIYADQRERLRRTFKASYIRLLKGTPSSDLDEICQALAEKISTADRKVFRRLTEDGFDMVVLSCGTADLSERTLGFAGLSKCFTLIEGNRFRFADDRIVGMELRLPDPTDKLQMMHQLNLSPDLTMVVGDGYTDLPLLDWSKMPVLIDRSGSRKKQFTSQNFCFISSIPEIMSIIKERAHYEK
jgi:phosphoserine phosphatase